MGDLNGACGSLWTGADINIGAREDGAHWLDNQLLPPYVSADRHSNTPIPLLPSFADGVIKRRSGAQFWSTRGGFRRVLPRLCEPATEGQRACQTLVCSCTVWCVPPARAQNIPVWMGVGVRVRVARVVRVSEGTEY